MNLIESQHQTLTVILPVEWKARHDLELIIRHAYLPHHCRTGYFDGFHSLRFLQFWHSDPSMCDTASDLRPIRCLASHYVFFGLHDILPVPVRYFDIVRHPLAVALDAASDRLNARRSLIDAVASVEGNLVRRFLTPPELRSGMTKEEQLRRALHNIENKNVFAAVAELPHAAITLVRKQFGWSDSAIAQLLAYLQSYSLFDADALAGSLGDECMKRLAADIAIYDNFRARVDSLQRDTPLSDRDQELIVESRILRSSYDGYPTCSKRFITTLVRRAPSRALLVGPDDRLSEVARVVKSLGHTIEGVINIPSLSLENPQRELLHKHIESGGVVVAAWMDGIYYRRLFQRWGLDDQAAFLAYDDESFTTHRGMLERVMKSRM